MNLYGIPMVGSDICGFNGNSNAELCARWMAVGSFYTFSRNHNTIGAIDQYPFSFKEEYVLTASRNNLYLRYSLLQHLYSIFLSCGTLGNFSTFLC